jgi:hypothetical protein
VDHNTGTGAGAVKDRLTGALSSAGVFVRAGAIWTKSEPVVDAV